MHSEFIEALENSPVIAAVKDDDGLQKCLETDSSIVFILYGDICNIPRIVETVKSAGKIAMVHVDLIHGLSPKEIAIDFIHQYTKADGIISTKALLIKRAGAAGDVETARFLITHPGGAEDAAPSPEQVQRDLARLDQMVGYCKTRRCLRGYILDYFGQAHQERCSNCGNCSLQLEERDITGEARTVLSCAALKLCQKSLKLLEMSITFFTQIIDRSWSILYDRLTARLFTVNYTKWILNHTLLILWHLCLLVGSEVRNILKGFENLSLATFLWGYHRWEAIGYLLITFCFYVYNS